MRKTTTSKPKKTEIVENTAKSRSKSKKKLNLDQIAEKKAKIALEAEEEKKEVLRNILEARKRLTTHYKNKGEGKLEEKEEIRVHPAEMPIELEEEHTVYELSESNTFKSNKEQIRQSSPKKREVLPDQSKTQCKPKIRNEFSSVDNSLKSINSKLSANEVQKQCLNKDLEVKLPVYNFRNLINRGN